MMATNDHDTIHCMNTILRRELAAADRSQVVADGLGDRTGSQEVRQIRDHHVEAARFLHGQITSRGGEAEYPGLRHSLGAVTQRAARLLGDRPSLLALRGTEASLMRHYQDVARSEADTLPAPVNNYLNDSLLPHSDLHVQMLSRLIQDRSAHPDHKERS